MIAWIRNWTTLFEFSVIATIAFVLPFLGSLLYLLGRHRSGSVLFSEHQLLGTLIVEIATLYMIGSLLYIRKWDLRHLGLNPSWKHTAQGLVLYVAAVLAGGIAAAVVAALYPVAGTQLSSLAHGNPNFATFAALSMVNPFFEEVLVVGYVITSLEKLATTRIALAASVLLRTSYHLYQGPAGTAGNAVMGLIFAYMYVRKRQLWPLIVAHGIWNFLFFLSLT